MDITSVGASAAYVHIPFCRRRCFYCDFPISVVGDRPPLSRQQPELGFGTIAAYMEPLCLEIQTTKPQGGESSQPLETVFFGGGTPSLLTAEQLARILETLDQQFGIAATAEISMEIDPDTVDLSRLQGYKAAGINRVSLGVQAFQSELLAACGRTHGPDDIYRAVDLLHQVAIANFSLDLISGLPHQTLEMWAESLERAIALSPTHLSVYDLTVESGTAFAQRYQPGEHPLPSDDATAEMYRLAQHTLTAAGYEHYEISNYAQPGFQCRHNRVYWENRPYYGFGMAAASYINGQRLTRPRTRQQYSQWVEELVQNNGESDWPVVDEGDRLLDTLMLGLRLAEGLSVAELTTQFGESVVAQVLQVIRPYQQPGWVAPMADSTPARIQLTIPEGFLFSNTVLAALFGQLMPKTNVQQV